MEEWPLTASPTAPPMAVVYFGREIAGCIDEVCALPLREVWQAGTYVKELDMEDVELEDGGKVVHYYRVVQRDAEGMTIKRHKMRMWFVGTTWDDCLKRAKDVKLPYSVYQMLCIQMGKPGLSYFHWAGVKKETSSVAEGDDGRAAVVTRRERQRASRDVSGSTSPERRRRDDAADVVTLALMCAEVGVDPGDVRSLLRKRGIEKPGGGWTWIKGDDRIGEIMDVVKAVKRGERK
jgi:hypothetical protein